MPCLKGSTVLGKIYEAHRVEYVDIVHMSNMLVMVFVLWVLFILVKER